MKSFVSFVFFFFFFFVIFSVSQGNPYNKYGRSCKDILCTVREECVMERDACTSYSDKCGTYPTCKRKAGQTKQGCASMKCPSGHFCSIRQENCSRPPCEIKPMCIAFRTPAPSRQASSNNYNSRPSSNQYYNSRDRNQNQNRWSFN